MDVKRVDGTADPMADSMADRRGVMWADSMVVWSAVTWADGTAASLVDLTVGR
jgi:hypothetical protein